MFERMSLLSTSSVSSSVSSSLLRVILWLQLVVFVLNLWRNDGGTGVGVSAAMASSSSSSSSSSPDQLHSSSWISSTTVPPLLNVPTYSMATLNNIDKNSDSDDEDKSLTTTNMNIVTYATPVSTGKQPDQPRVWCVSLFKGTKSEENFRQTKTCILQVLTKRHSSVVPILGSTSGQQENGSRRKSIVCEENGLKWIQFKDATKIQNEGDDTNDDDSDLSSFLLSNISVLPHCAYYIHLTAVGEFVDAGSHVIVPYCKVDGMYVPTYESDVDNGEQSQGDYELLMTAYLRDLGIITKLGRVTEGLV